MDYEPISEELQKQLEEYQREAEQWRNAYLDLQQDFWHVPKPHLSSPVKVAKHAVSRFMNHDIEYIYKTYMVVAIVCAIASAISGIYSDTRRV